MLTSVRSESFSTGPPCSIGSGCWPCWGAWRPPRRRLSAGRQVFGAFLLVFRWQGTVLTLADLRPQGVFRTGRKLFEVVQWTANGGPAPQVAEIAYRWAGWLNHGLPCSSRWLIPLFTRRRDSRFEVLMGSESDQTEPWASLESSIASCIREVVPMF